MTDYDHLPFRACVGIVLLNTNNHVFVGERIDTPDAWQMPQGGIDDGEDIKAAAFRELYEETGVKNATILELAPEKIRYRLPDHLIQKLWQGRFQGQEQQWIAMRFEGDDREINLEAHIPHEFSRWQWLPLAETTEKIVPFKRETYQKVIAMFAHLTQ